MCLFAAWDTKIFCENFLYLKAPLLKKQLGRKFTAEDIGRVTEEWKSCTEEQKDRYRNEAKRQSDRLKASEVSPVQSIAYLML